MLHRRFAKGTQVSLWCKSDNHRPVSASEMNFDCATAGPASGFQALPAVTVLLLAIPFEMSVPCCPALGKLISWSPSRWWCLYLSVATVDESPVAVTYFIVHQMWQRDPRHVEADHYVEALRLFKSPKQQDYQFQCATKQFSINHHRNILVCSKIMICIESNSLTTTCEDDVADDVFVEQWNLESNITWWWCWWCAVQEMLKLGISITKSIQELRHLVCGGVSQVWAIFILAWSDPSTKLVSLHSKHDMDQSNNLWISCNRRRVVEEIILLK